MQQQGMKKVLYAFPLFYLISQIFHKIVIDQTEQLILVVPTLPTHLQYPQLLEILISSTLLHLKQKDIFKEPLGKQYPFVMNHAIRLEAWKIFVCSGFHKQLPNLL